MSSVYVAYTRGIPVGVIAQTLKAKNVSELVVTDLSDDNSLRMAASVAGIPIVQTIETPWANLEGVKDKNIGTRQNGDKFNRFAHLKAVDMAVETADSVLAILEPTAPYRPLAVDQAFRLHKPVATVMLEGPAEVKF